MRKILLGMVVLVMLMLFSMNISFADRLATFSWDANIESDLAGYKLYEKLIDNNYVLVVDVGVTTTHPLIIADNLEHTYVLTAYDTVNNESGYSEEAVAVAVPIDTTAPGIVEAFNINIQVIVTP